MDLELNINRGAGGAPPARVQSLRPAVATGHAPPGTTPAPPEKKPCDAPEGWCRVCERMSDVPVLRSEDLLQGHREVLILHGDQVYRLLCTRNGKLILQK